jgi:hypothetical protein
VKLSLGPGLELPLDAITQTFGILAVRGAGKSNLAAVMAEEMHRARLPFVVVDPVGSWWGLRSSADGAAPGLEVPIFGGRHGDVPLEKTGGQVLADLVVDERVSCVLDISEFSEGDKTHFLIDFAERLYRRNTEPLHLFLEEADDYAPQRPFREQARLLRAWENVVRRGRARGLGITLITQRSAALNKSVLTQIETLFVLRTTSPQDRKAIAAWVEYHGQAKELLASLEKLAPGEAWAWSPSWLKLTKRVQIRRRSTFDSAATPKNVRGARPAATLADVDLAGVRARMAATIERAKKEDPRELRRRIAELERELKAKPAAPAVAPAKVNRIEIPVVSEAKLERLAAKVAELVGVASELRQTVAVWRDLHKAKLAENPVGIFERTGPLPGTSPAPTWPRVEKMIRTVKDGNGHDESVGRGGLRRILTALAQRPQGLNQRQLGLRAGLSSRSGTFSTYLGRARSSGWIEGRGDLRITALGLAALGNYDPLPEGRELLDYWLNELGDSGQARMLRVLAQVYPNALSNEALGEAAGISSRSGTFSTYLGRLRGLELIEGRGMLRASEELFS